MSRGLIQVAGVTPSDASHVLKKMTAWDAAAQKKLFCCLAEDARAR